MTIYFVQGSECSTRLAGPFVQESTAVNLIQRWDREDKATLSAYEITTAEVDEDEFLRSLICEDTYDNFYYQELVK